MQFSHLLCLFAGFIMTSRQVGAANVIYVGEEGDIPAENGSKGQTSDILSKVEEVIQDASVNAQKEPLPYQKSYQLRYPTLLPESLKLEMDNNRGERPQLSTMKVNSPKQMLDLCCQYPACYDPLYSLCVDTCRESETVFPVTSWLPCPQLLNMPDCTSPYLSYMGPLYAGCYPDIGPLGNTLPMNLIVEAALLISSDESAAFTRGEEPNDQQLLLNYRASLKQANQKVCDNTAGICRGEGAAKANRGLNGAAPFTASKLPWEQNRPL